MKTSFSNVVSCGSFGGGRDVVNGEGSIMNHERDVD